MKKVLSLLLTLVLILSLAACSKDAVVEVLPVKEEEKEVEKVEETAAEEITADTDYETVELDENFEGGEVRVYATNYNVLRIMSGMGGLAYSN